MASSFFLTDSVVRNSLGAIRVFQLHYLAVLLRELLVGADDVVEVRVHELRADVHVVERLRDRRRDHVPDANDLLFVQKPKWQQQPASAGYRRATQIVII